MWSSDDGKTRVFPGAGGGGDKNNNETIGDAATAELTPPYQIPKYPIRTTRPPSVTRGAIQQHRNHWKLLIKSY